MSVRLGPFRRVSMFVVVAFLASLGISPASAGPAPAPAPTKVGDAARGAIKVRARPDTKNLAPAQRRPQVEQWTPVSHSVTDASGETRVQMYAAPTFRRTKDGWKPLSGVVRKDESAPLSLRAGYAAAPTTFGSRASSLMSLDLPRGNVSVGLKGGRNVAPTSSTIPGGSRVVYKAIMPGVDLSYDVAGARVKEQLVLASAASPSSFTFEINDPAHLLGKPKAGPGESYSFSRPVADGTYLTLAAPASWEQRSGPATGPKPLVSAHQVVRQVKGGYRVALSVDKGWLQGKSYPIVLDPTMQYSWAGGTINSAYGPIWDQACLGDPCPLSSTADGSALATYSSDVGSWWAYYHMDLSSIPTETKILSSTLSLGWEPSEEYDTCSNDVNEVDQLLQPGATGADLALATGDNVGVLAVVPGSVSASGHDLLSLGVTQSVRDWVAAGVGERAGFALRRTCNFGRTIRLTSAPVVGLTGDPVPGQYYGAWFYDPVLTIVYTGRALPPPIPVEQTWGCDCRWQHGADRSTRVADPINTADGHATETETDLQVAAPGIPMAFRRTYNGLDAADGPMGVGWTHEYNARLVEDVVTGGVTFKDPTGGRSRFVKQPDDSYLGDVGVTGALAQVAEGGWTLGSTTGEVLTFDAAGQVISDVDAAGNGLTLSYTGTGPGARLTGITDAVNRTTMLTYGTSGAADTKLTEVAAPDGRTVGYGYSTVAGASRLTQVTGTDGAVTTLTYDPATGRLSGVTTPRQDTGAQNVYDPVTGRVTQQTDQGGNVWTFGWDEATQTQTSTDPLGNSTQDVYYGNVLIKHVDQSQFVTEYYYDEDLNLEYVLDPRGYVTSMTYDARGNMVTKTSPAPISATESWTYDANNNMTSHTDARAKTTTYAYNGSQQLTSVTDPLANATTYTYTPLGQLATTTTPEGHTTTYGYDTFGNLVSQTSPEGHLTTLTNDTAGRVTASTDPRGNVAGATAEDFTTHYTYDDAGRVLTSTDAADTVTTNTYDPNGNNTARLVKQVDDTVLSQSGHTYDALDRLLTTTESGRTTVTNTYDGLGHIATSTDATGATTEHTYDPVGHLASTTTPRGHATTEVGDDHTWRYSYDPAGNRTSVTDPAWASHETVFDGLNRPTLRYTPSYEATTSTYDAAGNLTKVKDPLGNTTTNGYDDAGRRVSVALPGEPPTTYGYDDDGNTVRATSPSGDSTTTWAYDADGHQASQIDPRGNVPGADPGDYTTTYGYDPAGDLTALTDQLGHATTWAYDRVGNKASQTDALDRVTTWDHDGLGRLTAVTPPGSNGATSYAYDAHGDLVARTDALGHATAYTYSNRHEITSVLDPLERQRTFGYDLDGNQVTTITARGHESGATPADWTITQTFDQRGLRTGISTGQPASSATYAYDWDGRIAGITDVTGTTGLSYDSAARLTQTTHPQGDYGYTYTAAGRVATRSYPAGGTIEHTYNDDGLPTALTASGATTTFGYNPDGALDTITAPAAVAMVETRGYDRTGNIASITNQKTGQPNPTSSYAYTRDPVGNPLTIATTRATTSTSEAFTYDAMDRLAQNCLGATTCENNPTAFSAYAYDKVGNRTSAQRVGITGPGTTTYTHDAADQVTSTTTASGTTAHAYNADGLLTSQGRTWDALGRLTASNVNGAASYGYDGLGNRRTVTTSAGERAISWDTNAALPQIGVITTPGGSVDAQRSAPDGTPLATQHTGQAYDASHYGHGPMGSVTDVTTGDGTPAWNLDYEPFGATRSTNQLTTGAIEPRFGYGGAYQEETLGQYHLRARDYDTTLGRFVAPDPITPSVADPYVSAYAYANSRPTLLDDPSGLFINLLAGGVGAVLGGVLGAASYAATNQDNFSWGELGKQSAIWGAAGAVTGVTFGLASGVVAGALGGGAIAQATGAMAGGAVANYYGATTESVLNGNGLLTPEESFVAGGSGLLGGAGGVGVSRLASELCPPLANAAKSGSGRLSTVLKSGDRGAIGRGLSPNQMNRAINRGQGPSGITRIDTPKIPHEKLHATFEDGSALNVDGTWKHGGLDLTRSQSSWLVENGWTLP